ncbi:rCG40868 [Rattus norvegicus]|uniref:RCG40868 n=1 Tax=Rattus norvegicus TaxID=10116 RepID=A6KKV8_RAT|nr:rCG40868 [Rattus norvegicus]
MGSLRKHLPAFTKGTVCI